MKVGKLTAILLGVLLLAGCTEPAYERVEDGMEVGATVPAGQIRVEIPQEFAAPVMEQTESGTLYLWEDISLVLQTMEGGDLDRTFRTCTGFGRDELTVLKTSQDEMDCYVCAWTAAGEGTDQVGRLAILDDGNYHYTVSLMAPADQGDRIDGLWREIKNSFQVNTAA